MTDTSDATAVDLAEVFGELAIDLEDAAGVEPTVGTVLEFAVAAFKCTDAGIVLVGPGGRKNLRVAEVTNPVVAELYQLQIDAGSGPLIEAAEGSEPVLVDDTRAESRWPGWAERAAGQGIGTVLHHPMLTKSRTIGVLSFYSPDAGAFTAYDEALAQILCQHATVAVAYARNEETLTEALEARAVVGQAIGILIERHNLTERNAFNVLRRYSQDYNVKLRSIADQLISSRSLPPPPR